jgi:hypothetical protein
MHSKLEEITGSSDLNCFREVTEYKEVEVSLCGNGNLYGVLEKSSGFYSELISNLYYVYFSLLL